MKKFFATAFAALLIVLSLVLYVNISFSRLKVNPFYNDCRKVWGHAGYSREYGVNSLPGYKQAFDLGAKGVELDVHYDPDLDRFIVSHDFPYKRIDGKLLRLEDVLNELGNRGYFWLDFKNLKHIGKKEAAKAARRLSDLIERYHVKDRVIVESKDAINLTVLSRAGIPTSYWVNVNRNKEGFSTRLRVFGFKAMFLYGRFSAVSMDHRNYTPYLQETFKNLPVHLFTINREEEILEHLYWENVKVILSDENFFALDGCARQ
jgi:glycerophosphoryl diester phosphodiesterase